MVVMVIALIQLEIAPQARGRGDGCGTSSRRSTSRPSGTRTGRWPSRRERSARPWPPMPVTEGRTTIATSKTSTPHPHRPGTQHRHRLRQAHPVLRPGRSARHQSDARACAAQWSALPVVADGHRRSERVHDHGLAGRHLRGAVGRVARRRDVAMMGAIGAATVFAYVAMGGRIWASSGSERHRDGNHHGCRRRAGAGSPA